MLPNFDIAKEYKKIHSSFPGFRQQPIIAITGNFNEESCSVAEGYYMSVLKSGGSPLILPPYENKDALISALDRIDGLLLTGGGDINPLYLGEEPIKELHSINSRRDKQEILLTQLAVDRQIPILGICRGMQIIAAALGGELYQDIHTQMKGIRIKHDQNLERSFPSHSIEIKKGTLLHSIFKTEHLAVNSFHHQAVKSSGMHFKVSATASDDVIEAIESCECKSILGVQWHPECMILNNDTSMMPVFEWLVNEASSFQLAKNTHQNILTLDSHCDTPMFFGQNIQFHTRDPKILVDLHKMNEGHLDSTIMVAYLKQEGRSEEDLLAATAKADQLLNQIEEMVANNCTAIEIARTPDELFRHKKEGKRSIMMGIENGYAIGKDIANIERFRRRGIVYITLCHNGDNDICDSARGNHEHNGLSEFGSKVVEEMNRVGLMVDLSHASEKSFYDALNLSKTPIICSHSSCRTLCDHPRNLTDEQMKVLAHKGGVMQLCLYSGFLRKDGQATILDAIDHLNHMINVMGIDHVGIGSDFDGDGGITGCESASEIINITRRLLAEGFSENDIQKIWGGNFLRVMQEVQDNQSIIL